MTFKLKEKDIRDILSGLNMWFQKDPPGYKQPIIQTIESVLAYLETMPPEDRIVYLLGRKA